MKSVVRHIRRNLVGYVALLVALTMTPVPTHANHLVVRASDMVKGAVTRPKIRDGAVNARKMADGAVRSSKLAAVVTRNVNVEVAAGAHGEAVAECLPGEQVLSGGGRLQGFTPFDNDNTFIVASFKTAVDVDQDGWFVKAKNETVGPLDLFVEVYCLSA